MLALVRSAGTFSLVRAYPICVEGTMYCNYCGKSIQDDANICAYCGTRVGAVIGRKRLVVVYTDSSSGREALKQIERAAAANGSTLVASYPVAPGALTKTTSLPPAPAIAAVPVQSMAIVLLMVRPPKSPASTQLISPPAAVMKSFIKHVFDQTACCQQVGELKALGCQVQ